MNTRYVCLDRIRGITLVSMIAFHAVWDLTYIAGFRWSWFESRAAYAWQQSICWTFILLSGFCWSMGRKRLKRGITVFLAGILVSLATLIADPNDLIIFGVLTLLGTSMLLMIPLENILKKVPAIAGIFGSVFLFVLTRNINFGNLGFEKFVILPLSRKLYSGGYFMTFLGFTSPTFVSADYFSLMPWLFLFVTGYFLYRLCSEHGLLKLFKGSFRGFLPESLEFLGRHSLTLYLLHQPVLYGVTMLIVMLRS